MSLRNVSTFGTKGVGGGMGRDRRRLEAKRRHWQDMVMGVLMARTGRLRIIVGLMATVQIGVGVVVS